MRNRLLVFGGFTDDAQGVLAAVHRLALVRVKLPLDSRLRVPLGGVSRELSIAVFADSEYRNVSDPLHDPKVALWHEDSLAHGRVAHRSCGFQTAPLPKPHSYRNGAG